MNVGLLTVLVPFCAHKVELSVVPEGSPLRVDNHVVLKSCNLSKMLFKSVCAHVLFMFSWKYLLISLTSNIGKLKN